MYQMCPYSFCDRDTITFMFIRRNEDLNTQQRSSEESRRLATSLKLSQIEPFVKIEVVVVNLLEKIFTEFIFFWVSHQRLTTWVISFMELFLLASFSSPFVMKPSLNSYNPFYQPTFNLFSMCANILYSSNILFWTILNTRKPTCFCQLPWMPLHWGLEASWTVQLWSFHFWSAVVQRRFWSPKLQLYIQHTNDVR